MWIMTLPDLTSTDLPFSEPVAPLMRLHDCNTHAAKCQETGWSPRNKTNISTNIKLHQQLITHALIFPSQGAVNVYMLTVTG